MLGVQSLLQAMQEALILIVAVHRCNLINQAMKIFVQRWAVKEGIGACLIDKPDFVADVVRSKHHALAVNSAAQLDTGHVLLF